MDVVRYINELNWHDCSLNSILIDYSNIIINLEQPDAKNISLKCVNFIGITYLGQWDENIVDNIKIVTSSPEIYNSIRIIEENNSDTLKGAGTKTINSLWIDIIITLIDNVEIHVVCDSIVLN